MIRRQRPWQGADDAPETDGTRNRPFGGGFLFRDPIPKRAHVRFPFFASSGYFSIQETGDRGQETEILAARSAGH
jgi:hypothetical protein